MAQTKLGETTVNTSGDLPKVGDKAPAFKLTTTALTDVGLDEWKGKKKIITVNPSLDTGVCQKAARVFNEKIAGRDDAVLLYVSSDLPFAAKRFCEGEGLSNVHTLTLVRDRNFAKDYGVLMTDGKMRGLVARAVFVLDADDVIKHVELVPAIGQEPDYDAALAALG